MAKLIILGTFLTVIRVSQCLPIVDDTNSPPSDGVVPNPKDSSYQGPPPPADIPGFIDIPWGTSHLGTETVSVDQQGGVSSHGNQDVNNPSEIPHQIIHPPDWGPPINFGQAMGDGNHNQDVNNPSEIPHQIIHPPDWGPPINFGQAMGDGNHVGEPVGVAHSVGTPFDTNPLHNPWLAGLESPFFNPQKEHAIPTDLHKGNQEGKYSPDSSPQVLDVPHSMTQGQEIKNQQGISHQILDLPNIMVPGQEINNPAGIANQNIDVSKSVVSGQEGGVPPGISHQIIDIPDMLIGDQMDFTWGHPVSPPKHDDTQSHNVDSGYVAPQTKESNKDHASAHPVDVVPIAMDNVIHVDPNQKHTIPHKDPTMMSNNDIGIDSNSNKDAFINVDHAIPVDPHLIHGHGDKGHQGNGIGPYAVGNPKGNVEVTTCKNENNVDNFLRSLISDSTVNMDNNNPSTGALQDAKQNSVSVSDVNHVADIPITGNIFPKVVQSNPSNSDDALDITGKTLDNAHANFVDFWLQNPDTMLTEVNGPAVGPPIPFPPIPFESTTTPLPVDDSNTAVNDHGGSLGSHISADGNGHEGHHTVKNRKCEGVVKDSTGKITHIVDTHDCSLLPVIDSHVTGGHAIDPHNKELLLAVDSKSFIDHDNMDGQPQEISHHSNTGLIPIVPVEKLPLTGTKANVLTSSNIQTTSEQKKKPLRADYESGFTASELKDQLKQKKLEEKKQRVLERQRIRKEKQEKRRLARQKAREERARRREEQRRQKQRERELKMQEKRNRLQEKKRNQEQKLKAQAKRKLQRQKERARKKAARRAKARLERQRKRQEQQKKKRQMKAARRKKENQLKRKAKALKTSAQKKSSEYQPADDNGQVTQSEVTSNSPSVLEFLKQRQQTKQEMLRQYHG